MAVGVRKRKKITEAQYLAMERASQTRHEFLDGEIYAMTGASERRNLITMSTLASLLAEYLLIAQTRCAVEHYLRQSDGKWLLTEYNDLADVIELPSIGCRLALSDVYEQVVLLIKEEGPAWNLPPAQEMP